MPRAAQYFPMTDKLEIRIRARAQEDRKTLADVANAAGITPAKMSNWLQKKCDLREEDYTRVMGVLNLCE